MKMKSVGVALLLAAASGCGSDAGNSRLTTFEVGDAVTVSQTSPFAECTADLDPNVPFVANAEVEPWLAINPTNRDHMAATWQQDRYDQSGGCRGNVVSVTFDGGATWESTTLPNLTPCTGGEWQKASDPWVTFAANGELYSVSLAITPSTGTTPKLSGIVVHKSPDGGRTWGDPITISSTDEGFGEDKESMTADPFDPCTLYVTWGRFEAEAGPMDVLFSRTTDCGETWSAPSVVYSSEPLGFAPQIAVLPDGTLVSIFVENSAFVDESPLWVMHSMDRGETWTDEPIVAANWSFQFPYLPDAPAEQVRSGVHDIAVDRKSGALYVVWEQFTDGGPPIGIALTQSTDGGLTWTERTRIDRTPASELVLEQAFLPSVEVSDDGTIGVSYYTFQNDTLGDDRSDADAWFIHCHPEDGDCSTAEPWSEPLRLSARSFDYQTAPLVASGDAFLGDYLGLATAGSDFYAVIAVTTENDPGDAVFVPILGR